MNIDEFYDSLDENSLEHHGILGMKWGVRRYQNPDGTLTSAGKKRAQSNKDYRNKLAKKALSKKKGFSEKKNEKLKEIDNLKTKGVNSPEYKEWKQEQYESRKAEYGSWYDYSTQKYSDDRRDRINADKDIASLIKERQNSISKIEQKISKWDKSHSNLMSMKVDALTKKSDIEGAYKNKSKSEIEKSEHAKKVAIGAAAVAGIIGVSAAYYVGKNKYLSDIAPDKASAAAKKAYDSFLNNEATRYSNRKIAGELAKEHYSSIGDSVGEYRWKKELASNEERHAKQFAKADAVASNAYTKYMSDAEKANAAKVTSELVKKYGKDVVKSSAKSVSNAGKAIFTKDNMDYAVKLVGQILEVMK